jgi:hypothetical protein
MVKRVTVVVAAFFCVGLVIIFAPGFARDIEAGVMSVDKIQPGTAAGHSIASPEAGCSRQPWPYGCDWRASSEPKKKIARSATKNDRNRRNHHGLTIVRGNGFSANDEL